MKNKIILSSVAFSFMLLFSGCLAIGNRHAQSGGGGTLGQQLIDLKTAQTTGAITEVEYQKLKSDLIGNK